MIPKLILQILLRNIYFGACNLLLYIILENLCNIHVETKDIAAQFGFWEVHLHYIY